MRLVTVSIALICRVCPAAPPVVTITSSPISMPVGKLERMQKSDPPLFTLFMSRTQRSLVLYFTSNREKLLFGIGFIKFKIACLNLFRRYGSPSTSGLTQYAPKSYGRYVPVSWFTSTPERIGIARLRHRQCCY